jgi:acetyl-CoA synthetase
VGLIDAHHVTILYTAPTAIRAFMRWGDNGPQARSASLAASGNGRRADQSRAWMWYHKVIGKERCPIVDTWWQTETGAIMITPLPGCTTTKPGSATKPFFGVVPTS